MGNGSTNHEALTRRDYVKYGSALAGGGLLAGCSGDGSQSTPRDTGTSTETATSTTTSNKSYTVSMEPAGEVTFGSVPERWVAYDGEYADYGVALGMADGLQSIGIPGRYHAHFYDELSDVSVEKDSLTVLYSDGIDKEIFYEIDADVHLIDPQWMINEESFGLEQSDVKQLRTQVAPFIGNLIFRRNDSWHDYQYYTMYEAFEKVAGVFQREERFQQFKSFHDEYIGRVQEQLPPESERPSAALLWGGGAEPEQFSPYRVSDKGTNNKQWHDLGVTDAFNGTDVEGLNSSNSASIDYETLLDVDPEVILLRGHTNESRAEFEDTVLAYMEDHSVASQLTAVQSGRVLRGGPLYQGPVINLFTTERAATGLYPDTFSGELFDRQRVTDIIYGEF